MSFDVDPRDRMIAALKGQIATYREQSVLDAIALGDKDAEIERLRAALESLTHDPPATLDEPDTDAEVIVKMRDQARRALEAKL